METKLDHENFEGAKVLADIGLKIAAGRALLRDLETTKDAYLAKREDEAVARIRAAIESSKGMLEELERYHSELNGYRTDLTAFAEEVRCLIEDISQFRKSFEAATTAILEDLEKKQKQVDDGFASLRNARILLDAERRELHQSKADLGKEKKKLRDEWAALERAAAEIKSKK